MASMYAVYHGPDGLRKIARRVHLAARTLAAGLAKLGRKFTVSAEPFFDTVHVTVPAADHAVILATAHAAQINLRDAGDHVLRHRARRDDHRPPTSRTCSPFSISAARTRWTSPRSRSKQRRKSPLPIARTAALLAHPVFNSHHTEHEMLRYMRRLEAKDLSLTHSMISLGSCTMKLNATSEMFPVTWPEFGKLHPFAPAEQTAGYREMCRAARGVARRDHRLRRRFARAERRLAGRIRGPACASANTTSRAAKPHRNVCLIPTSAHGTNPASAVMAGMKVVPVKCDANGNIDMADLRAKAEAARGQPRRAA